MSNGRRGWPARMKLVYPYPVATATFADGYVWRASVAQVEGKPIDHALVMDRAHFARTLMNLKPRNVAQFFLSGAKARLGAPPVSLTFEGEQPCKAPHKARQAPAAEAATVQAPAKAKSRRMAKPAKGGKVVFFLLRGRMHRTELQGAA